MRVSHGRIVVNVPRGYWNFYTYRITITSPRPARSFEVHPSWGQRGGRRGKGYSKAAAVEGEICFNATEEFTSREFKYTLSVHVPPSSFLRPLLRATHPVPDATTFLLWHEVPTIYPRCHRALGSSCDSRPEVFSIRRMVFSKTTKNGKSEIPKWNQRHEKFAVLGNRSRFIFQNLNNSFGFCCSVRFIYIQIFSLTLKVIMLIYARVQKL